MSYPMLPMPAAGEVLLVGTVYRDAKARWDNVPGSLGGRWDGDVFVLGDDGPRLRAVEDPRWHYLHGGNFPALVPPDVRVPVLALVDIPVVFGGGSVLLVDLREIPGRGVRVPSESLERVLTGLSNESLRFDELVRAMDRFGRYEGDGGKPANPTPTDVIRTSFPSLPSAGTTLLVRTDFTDQDGWHAVLDRLDGVDGDNRTWIDDDKLQAGEASLTSLVVDNPAFESLQPGQVPALVPPDEHVVMVALADAVTMADTDHSLHVVDLYDTPGQAVRIPLSEVGSMACNLEIANMDFADFA